MKYLNNRLNERDFRRKFNTIDNHFRRKDETFIFETFGMEANFVSLRNIRNIWTLISDGTETILIPGYHISKRMGYILTKEKWNKEDELTHYIWENIG